MTKFWLSITGLVIVYIVVLVVYFLRRSKSHEAELAKFLNTAKEQVELHKKEASRQADVKIAKAQLVVKKVIAAAQAFENEAKVEYDRIILEGKTKKKAMLEEAKTEIESLFEEAEEELELYRLRRQQEIEKNLVKMVMAVTEKVVETSLSPKEHKTLIFKALDEIKAKKSRGA